MADLSGVSVGCISVTLPGFVTYLSLSLELPWCGHLNTTLESHFLLGNHICSSQLLLTLIYCLAPLYIIHTIFSKYCIAIKCIQKYNDKNGICLVSSLLYNSLNKLTLSYCNNLLSIVRSLNKSISINCYTYKPCCIKTDSLPTNSRSMTSVIRTSKGHNRLTYCTDHQ